MLSAAKNIRKILIRSTNWVGDAIMTVPALEAVKDNYPDADLHVLAKPWVAPVFESHPAVSSVIVYDRNVRHKGLKGLFQLAGELKTQRFDMAVLFQNALEAALIVWLARIPIRLGFNTDGRGLLLKPAIKLLPEDKRIHETEYYLRILERAGLDVSGADPAHPRFALSGEIEERAEARLRDLAPAGGFLLGIAPGAAYGTAKQWPADRYARAADLILDQRPGTALVFGGRSEAGVAAEVATAMKNRVVNLAGVTGLAEAAALIKRCALFLTNDSGLMHAAAAVGTPLVAVFGSTNPITTSPRGGPSRLLRRPVDCAPCMKPTCTRPTHECMEGIEPEEVAEAGLGLLDEGGL